MAAADRPRVLPAVKAGSSVPVDLSGAFTGTGLFPDGQTLPGVTGIDGEGNGYSSLLLASPLTWKDVQFTLGPAGKPDLVSCRGTVLPVKAGQLLVTVAARSRRRRQSKRPVLYRHLH